MLEPIVLFRNELEYEEEFQYAKRFFDVSETRVGLQNKLVIGRYSVLPFYKELERDLELQGSKLINSYQQHKYIADFQYYEDLKNLTPKTYFSFSDVPDIGPFVVKGKTNSRKLEWNKRMFAQTKQDAIRIALDLEVDDPLIHKQGTIIREYVPLKTLGYGLNGLPFANEWRFFFYGSQMLSHGFYWTLSDTVGILTKEGLDFAQKVADVVAEKANFFVVDIAEKQDGGWTLIELNDGQMSGLSGNFPETLYKGLKTAFTGDWVGIQSFL